jgi:hypothetical protein
LYQYMIVDEVDERKRGGLYWLFVNMQSCAVVLVAHIITVTTVQSARIYRIQLGQLVVSDKCTRPMRPMRHAQSQSSAPK